MVPPMTTALITGGTSGIGLLFAQRLAQQGHDLVLVARDGQRLEATAEQITETAAVDVETLRADLGDPEDVERVAERLASGDRPVDMLVNNAGFGIHTALTAADLSPHLTALDVMCRAVLVLGGTAARSMALRGRGTIINVSSTAGFMKMGGYSAAKAWVTAYSESLAVELRGTGVGVTALCPGWVRTEFHERARINTSAIPSGMWIRADDVVRTGLRDAARGRVVSIPTVRYRFLMGLVHHLPRTVVRAVSGKISSKRAPERARDAH